MALLPNETGACSVSDGCGVPRINQEVNLKPDVKKFQEVEGLREFVSSKLLMTNASHNEIHEALTKRYSSYQGVCRSNPWGFWIVDVFDRFCCVPMMMIASKLFKRSYTFDEATMAATLGSEVEEVAREVIYKSIGGQIVANSSTDKEEITVSDAVKALVDGLITNKDSKFVECDRVFLETLDENMLGKLEPVINEVMVQKEVEVEKIVEVEPKQLDTVDAVMDKLGDIASPEAREFISNSVAKAKKHRSDLLAGLVANSQCPYSEAELQDFSTDLLEKTQSAFEARDYSGVGIPAIQTQAEDNMPPPPPGVVLASKEAN